MLNPPEISQGLNGSTCGNEELTRYRINLKEGTVEGSTFPNGINSVLARYVNKFDFPTINEAYRGKEVFLQSVNLTRVFKLKLFSFIVLYHLWMECL